MLDFLIRKIEERQFQKNSVILCPIFIHTSDGSGCQKSGSGRVLKFFSCLGGFGLAKKFSGLVRVCQKKGKKVCFTTKR